MVLGKLDIWVQKNLLSYTPYTKVNSQTDIYGWILLYS